MEEQTICLQCGDRGFTNAFVYCVRCLKFALHRYCLPVIPETLDEFVRWFCDDCESEVQSRHPAHKHDVSPYPTRDCKMSKRVGSLSKIIMEKNDLAAVETQTDERVHKDGHEQSSDSCAKLDLAECGDQLDDQMQLEGMNNGHPEDERERSLQDPSFEGFEEKKVKAEREGKTNAVESGTNEDQHKLGKRKREAQIPKKKRRSVWTHNKRKRKRKRVVTEKSDTKKDQHIKISSDQSHEEHMNADIDKCARPATEEREKTCIPKKPCESDSDPGSVEHNIISSDEPLRKKQKTIELSKLVSINDRIINEEPEIKEVKASATLHRSDICGDYPKELHVVAAEPVVMPIWRGRFRISKKKYYKLDELIAHVSSKACQKVYEVASQFQPLLRLEMLTKSEIWPKSFESSEPSGDNIALYFFSSKISEHVFDRLVEKMITKELALKAIVQNAELLIFASTELPLRYWRFCGKYYLWGVFRGKQNPPSSKGVAAEIPPVKKRRGDGSPCSPLSNSPSGNSSIS